MMSPWSEQTAPPQNTNASMGYKVSAWRALWGQNIVHNHCLKSAVARAVEAETRAKEEKERREVAEACAAAAAARAEAAEARAEAAEARAEAARADAANELVRDTEQDKDNVMAMMQQILAAVRGTEDYRGHVMEMLQQNLAFTTMILQKK